MIAKKKKKPSNHGLILPERYFDFLSSMSVGMVLIKV